MTDVATTHKVAQWLSVYQEALEAFSSGGQRQLFDQALNQMTDEMDLPGSQWKALNRTERRILLVALASELNPSIGQLYSELSGNMTLGRPSIATCLFFAAPDPAERLLSRPLLSPGNPLIEGGWLKLQSTDTRPWLEKEVTVSSGVVQMILGQPVMTTDRNSLCKIWEHGPVFSDVVLPEPETQLLQDYLQRVRGRRPEDKSLVLLLTGPSGTGKTLSARALAHNLQRPLLLVDPIGGLFRKNELEDRLAQMVREARLLNGILFFDECEGWFESRIGGDRNVLRMLELLDRQSQDVILATNLPDLLDPALDRRVALRLDYKLPNRGLRSLLWEKHLSQQPHVHNADTAWLAERYELTGGHISNASEAASQLARIRGAGEPITHQDVETAAEQQVRHRLSRLAVETPTHLKLEDLIIPDEINDILLEIIAAVRNRRKLLEKWGFGRRISTGKGLCILFKGDPGTGKTLAAEVLSSELRLPLYRASVARIVSKYVGETERNLEKTFKEASAAGGILLFDEADSLFSKRIEVSSAQDRYSNMEINLLLQEVERFDGVVILTTNLTAAIDSAFDRRLNFKVDFPFPKPDERSDIWKILIPQEAPVSDDIDYTLLGKLYELSGGSIKNVILRAAYKAAQHNVNIDMRGLEAAAKQEYRELGKLLPDGGR